MKLNFHLLTAFPPHNVNRDEDGRPKTALYGSVLRGRISSQAKKRAMRFSSHFSDLQRATRTRELGVLVFKKLSGAGISEDLAAWTALATLFAVGSGAKAERKKAQELLKPKAPEVTKVRDRFGFDEAGAREHVVLHALRSEQGLVVSTRELERLNAELESLIEAHRAAADGFDGTVGEWVERVCKDGLLDAEAIDEDTALFGRMVAANPTYNHEAAATVSHAVTTHEFTVEGDYFSAGEELNELRETGAAITSYAFYGGGVYYLHSVLDLARLTAGASPPSRTAIQRVSSLVSSATLTTVVSGTDSSMPTGPRTQPQTIIDSTTISGDSPRRRPMKRGSMPLETPTLSAT